MDPKQEAAEMRRLRRAACINLTALAVYVLFILAGKWYAGLFMVPAWLIFPVRCLRQYRDWEREQKAQENTESQNAVI